MYRPPSFSHELREVDHETLRPNNSTPGSWSRFDRETGCLAIYRDMDMTTLAPQAELRLTVGRFLELAYRKDEELTARLIRQAGPVRLAIDDRGSATLSGSAGHLAFSASEALTQLGVKIKFATVMMMVGEDGSLRYNATFRSPYASASIAGSIDVERLITHCSGLLCRAARALQTRPRHLDHELSRAMGQ